MRRKRRFKGLDKIFGRARPEAGRPLKGRSELAFTARLKARPDTKLRAAWTGEGGCPCVSIGDLGSVACNVGSEKLAELALGWTGESACPYVSIGEGRGWL
jgi:hypothetical protein